MNRIIRYFPNTDLRNSHEGLSKLAAEHDIDSKNLKPGEFLVFANTALTGIKVFAPGNVVAYLKHPEGRRLDLNLVRLIPTFFHGTRFEMNKALERLVKMKVAA